MFTIYYLQTHLKKDLFLLKSLAIKCILPLWKKCKCYLTNSNHNSDNKNDTLYKLFALKEESLLLTQRKGEEQQHISD